MTRLRVLVVEDSERDATLMLRELRKAGYDVVLTRVETAKAMRAALRQETWDVVLADYKVPGFGALPALSVLKESGLDIPCIVISGTIGEETAVEAMRRGAADYVMKDKLVRLSAAVRRELQEAEVRRARRQGARRLQAQQEVTRLVSELTELETAYGFFLEAIGKSLDLEAGALWELDRARGALRAIASWEGDPDRLAAFREATQGLALRPGSGLPGRVWETGEPAWIEDVERELESPRAGAASESRIRSAFAFPVTVDGTIASVVELFSSEPGHPDVELLETTRAVGAQIGQFVKRLRTLQALKESEALKSAIVDSAFDCIVSMGMDGRVVDWNPAAEWTFGYSREEAVGAEVAELIVPERLRDAHRAALVHYRATGEGRILGKRIEMPATRKDGTEIAVELTVVRLPTGGPPLFTAFLRDITERKRSEEILRETQRYLEEAQAIAHVGSWVSGLRETDAIWWSVECYRIFGIEEGTRITVERFFSSVYPEDERIVRRASNAAVREGTPYDVVHRIVRPDGEIRVVHERAAVVRDEHGTAVRMVGTVQDITERVKSEDRDRFLASTSAELGTTLEYPGVLEKIARLGTADFADCVIVQVIGNCEPRVVVAHRRPEREDVARVALEHAGDPALWGAVEEVIATGKPLLFPRAGPDERAATPDHASAMPRALAALAVSSFACTPLRARGRVFGTITFALDNGIRRFDLFDLATAEDFARRAAFAIDNARLYQESQDSVRARDEFISIVGHELKTPVTPIRMQARSLERSLERGQLDSSTADKIEPRLKGITRAAVRLEHLVETLLDVSELTIGKLILRRQETDLVEVARSAIERMRGGFKGAGSAVSLSAERPVVGYWDRKRVEQVVWNLVSNAAKYGAGKPVEVIVSGDEALGRIAVCDQGVGIAPQEQKRIFERFERRAPVEHFGGFGLGLWIVRQIVDAHGGRVDVWSRSGEGSRFTVELPRRSPEAKRKGLEEVSSPEEGEQAQGENVQDRHVRQGRSHG